MRVIFVILTLIPLIVASQSADEKYLLISFEYSFKKSMDGKKGSLFIIDQDSIIGTYLNVYPLWLRGFSDSSLADCMNHKVFDRLSILMGENISLDSPYASYFHIAQEMIKQKSKSVQKITKKWKNGQKEVVTVSITPILGKFCFSKIPVSGQTGYFGRVYIPLAPIYFDEQFWSSEKVRYIKGYDYTEIFYHRRFY